VDIISVKFCWGYLCEGRAVDITVEMVCSI